MCSYVPLEHMTYESQCILYERTSRRHYFYVSYWRRDRYFTWSSERREGLAVCWAKAIPSFLSHFKTLCVVQVAGIEPLALQSSALPTELILPG